MNLRVVWFGGHGWEITFPPPPAGTALCSLCACAFATQPFTTSLIREQKQIRWHETGIYFSFENYFANKSFLLIISLVLSLNIENLWVVSCTFGRVFFQFLIRFCLIVEDKQICFSLVLILIYHKIVIIIIILKWTLNKRPILK